MEIALFYQIPQSFKKSIINLDILNSPPHNQDDHMLQLMLD